ncbi:putative mitochondrial protein AtMg00860 [Nicotiana tabacum]|uniref:Mitochondrial protein AtMg00860 n=1 Tax=Nicotiana tabacum TaxID=4097 RepID=A0AC58SEX0_TOBAC
MVRPALEEEQMNKFFVRAQDPQYYESSKERYAFGVLARKLLGFIVSRQGIELDRSKIKAIQHLPPPKNKKDVMRFLGRVNYISRFIAQSTVIYEPIFRMLRKDVATSGTEKCQKAFDKIKEYFSKPPVLVPPEPGRSLLLYLSVLEGAFGCVLGKHDETGRKKQAIYYLRKKFTSYEAQYSLLECT